MTKKTLGIFAILLLLASPSMSFAEEAVQGSTTEWLEDTLDTDSYDEDGCFC